MKESKAEKYLHYQITQIGGTTRKWVSPGHAGVPDRICFLNGQVFFVEMKTEIGRSTVRQQRERETLESHGADCYVVYGKSGVDQLISSLTNDKVKLPNEIF